MAPSETSDRVLGASRGIGASVGSHRIAQADGRAAVGCDNAEPRSLLRALAAAAEEVAERGEAVDPIGDHLQHGEHGNGH